MNSLRRLDDQMLSDVNGFARHTGWLHGVVSGYADYGVVLFTALLLAGLWLSRTRSDRALAAAGWACVATLLAVALNQPLVHHFHEARPYTDHLHILVLAHRSTDYSFPSDHSVMAGAVAVGLWLVDRRLGILAAVAAVLLAFARVYIAAHYPHDVIAGLAVGAAVVLVGWLLLARPITWLVDRGRATVLRPLLQTRRAESVPSSP
jgi:membrane-associated phospholipid phosphatase